MSRSLAVTPGYYVANRNSARIIDNISRYYEVARTPIDSESVGYSGRVLPTELDIFSELPQYVFDNEDAHQFLESLRKKIFQFDRSEFGRITLSKLRVAEHTDKTIILEWIFNYFRVYFGFDEFEGDFYGNAMNDPTRGEFHNEMKMMTKDEFDNVAEANLSYVVKMAQGENAYA